MPDGGNDDIEDIFGAGDEGLNNRDTLLRKVCKGRVINNGQDFKIEEAKPI